MAGHPHGSDTSTSAWAVLDHTDQNGPNILKGSVHSCILLMKTLAESFEKKLISKICKFETEG